MANQVLIIEDELPWYRWSTHNILTANGIAYDQVGSAQMATSTSRPYALVIIAAPRVTPFTPRGTPTWPSSSVRAGGGALWIGTATRSTASRIPCCPRRVLNDDIYADYGNVAAPGIRGWPESPARSGGIGPATASSATSTRVDRRGHIGDDGNPTLVDYAFGSGRVLITSLTLEIAWDLGWSVAPILQNSLLDMYVPRADIPWLSEDPTGGTVAPGECATVTVTFDSTGLAPVTTLAPC